MHKDKVSEGETAGPWNIAAFGIQTEEVNAKDQQGVVLHLDGGVLMLRSVSDLDVWWEM